MDFLAAFYTPKQAQREGYLWLQIGQKVCVGDVRLVVGMGGVGGPPEVPTGLFFPCWSRMEE